MKLKAVYEIQGLPNVLTGKRKSEGVANPGDIYEVDNATAKVHIAEGYAVDPNDDTATSTERFSGPQIIEGELAQDAPLTLNDIAPPAAPPKKAGKKKAAAAPAAEEAAAAPAAEEAAAAPAAEEAGVDDLGLDDDSDSVE